MRVQLQERSPGAPPRAVAAEAAAAELTYHRRVTIVEELETRRDPALRCEPSRLRAPPVWKCYDLC